MWENRAGTKDWWGALLESQLAAVRRTARSTGSCTTTSASTGRRCGSRTSPRTRPANGLAYVGDADLTNLLPGRLPDAVASDAESSRGATGSPASS